MIQFRNGWFHNTDLVNAVIAIRHTAMTEPTRWLKHGIDCKYVEIRVDMRTGDFIFLNAAGEALSNDTILGMFPELGTIEEFA